jgi:hypothetical protein
VRVDLLVTDRPITPSGTGRAAPRLSWSGVPTDGVQLQSSNHVIRSQAETPVLPKLQKTSHSAVDPSRKLQQHHWCSGLPLRGHARDVQVEVSDQPDPSVQLIRDEASGKTLFEQPPTPSESMVWVDDTVLLKVPAPLLRWRRAASLLSSVQP